MSTADRRKRRKTVTERMRAKHSSLHKAEKLKSKSLLKNKNSFSQHMDIHKMDNKVESLSDLSKP